MEAKRMKLDEATDNLSMLPHGILRNIFNLLPQKDHCIVGMVSKRFQEIIDSIITYKYKEDSNLKITEKNVQEIKAGIENKICDLCFKRVELENVTSIGDVTFILQSIGKEIEHLSMRNTAAYGSLACNVINIKSLELHFDNVLRSSINDNFDLRVFPFLEKLVFLYDSEWMGIPEKLLPQLKGPKASLTLKHLKLHCSKEMEQSLLDVIAHHRGSLETLEIKFLWFRRTSSWKLMLSSLKNLRKLSLSGNVSKEMFFLLKSLEHLELCSSELTDNALMELCNFSKLRSLKLVNCIQITKMGLLAGIAIESSLLMEELYLENIPKLDELGLRVMMSRFPNLRHLVLKKLERPLTKDSLASVFRYQTRLKSLSIDGCSNITDESLIGYENNPYSIRRLHLLEDLTLNDCRYLTDKTLIKGLHLPQLRSLNLGHCHKITLKGVEHIIKNCPSLVVLSIPSTVMTDHNALLNIGNGLKRLRELNITDCMILTENMRDHIRHIFDEMKDRKTNPVFWSNCIMNMEL